MLTILGIRSQIFSPFSRLRPYHRENTGSRLLRGPLSLIANIEYLSRPYLPEFLADLTGYTLFKF